MQPFELLKESRAIRYSHKRLERAPLKPVEETSRLGKIATRVKGFATKSKATLSAKYSRKEDGVELLSHSADEVPVSTRNSRLSYQPRRGEPPKDLFGDI